MADKQRVQDALEDALKAALRSVDHSHLHWVSREMRPQRRSMAVFVRWRIRTARDTRAICLRDLHRRRIAKRRGVTRR